MKLRGKIAIVTGGGSGIGRAAALLFARDIGTTGGMDQQTRCEYVEA